MKRPEGRKRRLKPWPHEADRLRQQSYEAADEAYKLIDAARKAYLARTDASTELRKALTYVVRNPRLAEAMIERAITLIDEKTHDLERDLADAQRYQARICQWMTEAAILGLKPPTETDTDADPDTEEEPADERCAVTHLLA
jgi:hypothetical protein